jgi:hypothetical protein
VKYWQTMWAQALVIRSSQSTESSKQGPQHECIHAIKGTTCAVIHSVMLAPCSDMAAAVSSAVPTCMASMPCCNDS